MTTPTDRNYARIEHIMTFKQHKSDTWLYYTKQLEPYWAEVYNYETYRGDTYHVLVNREGHAEYRPGLFDDGIINDEN